MDMNLYEAIKDRKNYLKEKKIKIYAFQLLKALEYMHKNGIFHRDIKPENILIKGNHLVLADLGSCKGIYSKPPFTEYVSTRWYRAPECLMTNGYYNFKMDIWGVGCVLFEISSLIPLFPGDNEIDQMQKIVNILGSPSEHDYEIFKKHGGDHINEIGITLNKRGSGINKYLGHCSSEFIDLIKKMLIYNPDERISAKQALQHNFFKEILESNTNNVSYINNNKVTSFLGNPNQSALMKSFINDSLSIIKSSEESRDNIFRKKRSKEKSNANIKCKLPNVKKNIQNSDKSGDSLSDENSDEKRNNNILLQNIKIKLPKLNKNKYSNVNAENINRNNSIEYNKGAANNCTQYLKGISMSKKMSKLKQKYISPYSQKVIFNLPKH